MKSTYQRSYLITFLFFAIIFLCTSTYAQWYKQQSGTTADLRGVWFADSINGWVCGDSGIVLHTSNGGQFWERQNCPVSVKLEDVSFLNLQTGWIVGDSGTVIHTTDGGFSWSVQQTTITSLLHNIQFVTPQKGFATGERETRISTYDGGITWQASAGSDSGTASISFYWIDESRGTIIFSDTSDGFQFHTVDAGTVWWVTLQISHLNDVWGHRAFYTTHYRNFYWSVGDNGKVLWIFVIEDAPQLAYGLLGQTEDTLDLYAVTMERGMDPLKLWSVGQQGWIISSIDTGQTWQTISSNTLVDLYEISFPMKNSGWAVGDSGIILRYDKTTFVNDPSSEEFLPDFYALDPYPNPFNPKTTIEFYITKEDKVTIEVFNLLGQKVKTLLNEVTAKGKHTIGFNATGLPSGIYFYRVNAGRNSKTKKMVLSK